MGTGYTRQSEANIQPDLLIDALDHNDEFNAIQAAFNSTSGHSHDGTTGEGPRISLLTSITGVLQVANGGINGIHRLNATINPTVNEDSNDGYRVGSWWINTTSDLAFLCLDASVGAAVWQRYQPWNSSLDAITMSDSFAALVSVTPATDTIFYFTGDDTGATTAFTPFARTLLAGANALEVSTSLGVVIGTNVQAWSANLDAWSLQDPNDYLTATEISAAYQPLSANLSDWALISPSDLDSTFQPLDDVLTDISQLDNDPGFLVKVGDGVATKREITGVTDRVSITNGDGTGGDVIIDVGSDVYTSGGTDVALADGGTGSSLTAPAEDALIFYDEGNSTTDWLTLGDGLTITSGVLDVTVSTEIASPAEIATGVDNTKAISPAGLVSKEATAAEIRENAEDKLLTTDQTYAAMEEVSLGDTATILWDMEDGIDFTVTLTGNRTLGNPTNVVIGRRGRIRVVQDGTGDRTLTKSSNHKTVGGLPLVIDGEADSETYIYYDAVAADKILLSTTGTKWE